MFLRGCKGAFAVYLLAWGAAFMAFSVLTAVLGGLLLGSGCLFLARHRASLGGATIVSLYLQRARGWRAGMVQMGMDCTIVLLAFCVTDWQHVLWSVLGAITLNQTLATNHRAGRYMAH